MDALAARSSFVLPESWAFLDSINPNTVARNGATVYATSKTDSVWSDETKVAFRFSTPLAALQQHRILLGVIGGGFNASYVPYAATGAGGFGGRFTWSVNKTNPRGLFQIRLRLITADFDTTTLTWNSAGALTLGATAATIIRGTKGSGDVFSLEHWNNGGGFGAPGDEEELGLIFMPGRANGGAQSPLGLYISTLCYGLLLEVQPTVGAGFTTNLTTAHAFLNLMPSTV